MADSSRSEWSLEWYKAGTETPAKAFLAGLQGRAKDEALILIEAVERHGNQLREPKSKAIGGGLFELRGHQVRIVYVFLPGHRIVLLDGMLKKRDDLPPAFVRRMRQMQAALLAAESRRGEARMEE
jgi:phage-related protein